MGGYSATKREFEEALRKITMLGFGLCCICHAEKKNIPGPNDTTIETVQPAMPSRAADVVNRMVDIIAYVDQRFDEEGNSIRRFITRRTPTVLAGSRLPYLDPVIPFSYDELIAAIGRAIDEQQKRDNVKVVDSKEKETLEVLNYTDIRNEALMLWKKLVGETEENFNEEMAARILKKAEIIFGHPVKLSEISEDQVDLFNLVVLEMRDLDK